MRWLYCLLAAGMLPACVSLPPFSQAPHQRIKVGPGPEDMDLDDFGYQERLLISCTDRINREDPQFGEIVAYYPANGGLDTLPRRGEPEGYRFFPHGIDFVVRQGVPELYVVCHDDLNHRHWIARYEVFRDHLWWKEDLESPLFTSPNDVSVSPEGVVWVSNDRENPDKIGEMVWGTHRASLVKVDTSGEASVWADGYAMGNGVQVMESGLYWAVTRDDAVFRVDPDQSGKAEPWMSTKGADNLSLYQDSLLLGAHLSSFAFFRHSKKPMQNKSPSTIYLLKPGADRPEVFFADDGSAISGASVGLVVNNKLYIGQVFGDFILEVDLWHR